MDERQKLYEHIRDRIEQRTGDPVDHYSQAIAIVVMDALDSWIEEQQPEQAGFKIGDRVALKRMLEANDGSGTAEECDVSVGMESLEKGSLGEILDIGSFYSTGHLLINFDDLNDDWWFHPDDVEKVP